MTAALKTKKTDPKTGALNVTYSNHVAIRNCTKPDFTKTGIGPSFDDLSVFKNLYCPDNYENITLASQRMKSYE
jgi:ABC-type uncharacterized transport system ATPase subunit